MRTSERSFLLLPKRWVRTREFKAAYFQLLFYDTIQYLPTSEPFQRRFFATKMEEDLLDYEEQDEQMESVTEKAENGAAAEAKKAKVSLFKNLKNN